MDTQICIIGAGVVGLAIAAELSKTRDGVYVIEKHKKFGQETSSRNSEVVHSGIYYPHGSLKARLCVEGRRMLYAYCHEKEVLFNKCGKFVVATDKEEATQLPGILKRAQRNGVEGAYHASGEEVKRKEPWVTAFDALYFPETGIVDSHGLMKNLQKDAQLNGAEIAYGTEVKSIQKMKGGYELTVLDEFGDFTFTTAQVINSAGLLAYQISQMAGIDDPLYQLYFWKGEYWAVGNGKNKYVNRLIYPVPETNTTGLGIHATVDLNRGLKLGPNAVYLDDQPLEYSVNPKRKHAFLESARRFLPFLEAEDLHPDQAGIRPKLQKPGDPVRDFIITNEKERGFPGFVNLIGIESPGLTSCLAIGKYVAESLL